MGRTQIGSVILKKVGPTPKGEGGTEKKRNTLAGSPWNIIKNPHPRWKRKSMVFKLQ